MAVENCMANQKDRDELWEEWCYRNQSRKKCTKGGLNQCQHYDGLIISIYQEEKETPTRE